MNEQMDRYSEHGAEFGLFGHYCELWSAPIPEEIDGVAIENSDDLFRMSLRESNFELFVPSSDIVDVASKKVNEKISRRDFVIWQIKKMTSQHLLTLICKVDGNFDHCLDNDEEYSSSTQDFMSTDYLSEYADDEDRQKGYQLIEWMRAKYPGEFYTSLYESIIDGDYGISAWLETDLSEDDHFRENIDKYSDWNVKLMTVAIGKFWPYIETNSDNVSGFMMDGWRVDSLFVRNYDEGDIE